MKRGLTILSIIVLLILTSCSKQPKTIISTYTLTIQILCNDIRVSDALITLGSIGAEKSNKEGYVTFTKLQESTYQLTVTRSGFAEFFSTYHVDADQLIRIELANQLPAPQGVQIKIDDGKLIVNWNQLEIDIVAAYQVYKSTDGYHFTELVRTDKDTNHVEDSEVTNGTVYYYYVEAIDIFNGISPASQIQYAIPNPTLPYTLLYSRMDFLSRTFDIYLLNGSDEVNITNTMSNQICSDYHQVTNQMLMTSDEAGKEDVYIASLDGTGRRRLTYSQSGVMEPKFSPDGEEFIYIDQSDQRIYIMNIDGTGKRIVTERMVRNVDWSVDGKIIFTSPDESGVNNLFIVNDDGTELEQLTFSKTPVKRPTWSPDGEKIAYVMSDGNSEQICLIQKDGSNRIFLTKLVGNFIDYLGWSPDGTEILYVFKANQRDLPSIYTLSLDNPGGGGRRIVGYGISPLAFN